VEYVSALSNKNKILSIYAIALTPIVKIVFRSMLLIKSKCMKKLFALIKLQYCYESIN